jgi:hypothetical protein
LIDTGSRTDRLALASTAAPEDAEAASADTGKPEPGALPGHFSNSGGFGRPDEHPFEPAYGVILR